MTAYPDFKEALKGFIEEVCEAFSRVEMPQQLWTRIVHEREGETAFPQELRPDLTSLVLRLNMALHTNPTEGLRKVIEVVRTDSTLAGTLLVDGGGKPITEEKAQQWWATNVIAEHFLLAYFDRAGGTAFDDTAFDTVFNRLIAELKSPVVTATELSPLMNCRLDCERIDIAPGLAIRKLTDEELEEWLNQNAEFPFRASLSPQISPMRSDCAIEVTYEKGRHEAWGGNLEVADKVSDLLTTLRLLTDRNVHLAFTKSGSDSILQPSGGTSSTLRPRRPSSAGLLNEDRRQEIVDAWNRIQALPTDNRITLALRRWDIVSERFDEDDALIDYWIALESLFLPDSTQELRFRASLRIAAFVGESADEREHAYKDLKDSYDLRSQIIHGGVPKSDQKSSLISKTRSYLRRALLKVLASKEPFAPDTIELGLLRRQ